MMKFLVTGASGFLGARIAEYLSRRFDVVGTRFQNSSVRIEKCTLFPLDICDQQAVHHLIDQVTPQVVIHIAGNKDISFCQAHPEAAHRINTDGTAHLISACQNVGARIVYISTDCVFDGQQTAYDENAPTNPINEYGKTKLAGEKIVLSSNLNAVIIRVSLIYGWALPGQESNQAMRVLCALERGEKFMAPINLFNTPISVEQAIFPVCWLADSDQQGIFHLAGRERISRYEFSVLVARTFGYDETQIIPTHDTSGLRPFNSCLKCSRLSGINPTWDFTLKTGLRHMLETPKIPLRLSLQTEDQITTC